MNIAEKAVKQNEIIELLEGKNGYQLENDSWASASAPIDWTRVVPMLYEVYAKALNFLPYAADEHRAFKI